MFTDFSPRRSSAYPGLTGALREYLYFIRKGFARSPLNRRVISISVPVVFGMLSHTVVWATDTAMVGVLGPEALAAAGVGGLIFHLALSGIMGAGMGIQIIVARRVGEKREREAGRVLLTALTVTVLGGSVFTWIGWNFSRPILAVIGSEQAVLQLSASYLSWRFLGILFYFAIFVLRGFFDGIGETTPGMISALVVMTSNVFLNWVMIYGNLGCPALGLDGAAMASSLAGLPGLFVFFLFFSSRHRVYFQDTVFSDFLNLNVIGEITKIGFPPAAENVTVNLAFLIFYKFAAMIGTVSIAATNIVITILSLSFLPGVAFGIAATTILGQAMGSGKFTLARVAVYRSAFYSALVMGAMGLVFILAGRSIIGIFTRDPVVLAEATLPLFLVALMQVPDAYNMVLAAALRGAGLVYRVLIAYLTIAYGLLVPAAYVFGIVLGFGTPGLWLGVVLWIVAPFLFFAWKFAQNDWKTKQV